MVEEGEDVSAFETFTLEDAGGEEAAPPPPREETSASSEPTDSGKSTALSSSSGGSEPVAQESEPSVSKLQTSLERWSKESAKKAALSGPGAPPTTANRITYEDIPISSMRKTIAARLTESMAQNPHYFVAATVSVTKLLKLRQALNSSANAKYKLSLNDFLIKACAVACKKVPTVNSSWRDGYIRQFSNVDISVAVATPVGLMTPIVKSVEGLGLESISAQVKDLGKRARDGKLKPEEYQGGTFTISNMGMNPAIDRFTAVINPPQAGILAVGTTKKVAIPIETEEGTQLEWDDQIVVTGSFDHKVVDGAVGAEWIREFKKVVENPLELLL
jgi:pyruvate dehydrogenase E2 component (dihydrolipoamide acetyltransferase)